ncbi:ATP-binding protein [Kitasatospora purpeofusca]|uniref:ATP-binding protein n=1 Tax=Kitasatospora purpeofusca TaxID=67352 RepID=A0ABZ1TXJ5_9ACTN|nr:ATP-binding protein [Kitasatospora purpeofusca]
MTTIAESPVRAVSDAAPTGTITAVFPYEDESASLARELMKNTLLRWGLVDLVENAVLVTSELMTNAIQTGCRCSITVTVEQIGESAVRISVEDGSRYPPVLIKSGLPANPDRVPAGGRGLVIVDGLCKRWGLDLRPRGKCVFAEIHGQRRSQR